MKLSNLLNTNTIKVGLEAADKEEAFEEMVDLLVRAGAVTDREAALRALHAREDEQTTGIGNGIGIPHAKDPSIEKLVLGLGTSEDGIEFDAVDGEPIHLVFLVLARTGNPGPHVEALAEIARLIQTPGFYRKVCEARTPEEAMALVREEEE